MSLFVHIGGEGRSRFTEGPAAGTSSSQLLHCRWVACLGPEGLASTGKRMGNGGSSRHI